MALSLLLFSFKTNPFTVDAVSRVIQLSPNITKLSFHLTIYSTIYYWFIKLMLIYNEQEDVFPRGSTKVLLKNPECFTVN